MQKQIKIKNKNIVYKIRQSQRAKRMRLAVYCDGAVVVTQPKNVSINTLEYYIKQKADWLIGKLEFFANLKTTMPPASHQDYLSKKDQVLNLVSVKIEKLNIIYGFKFHKINIKNQKTRWGSCSRKCNLNFNYRIIYLPDKVAEYIIAHELCHLREFNHSQKFWNLVSRSMPNYLDLKRSLKMKV